MLARVVLFYELIDIEFPEDGIIAAIELAKEECLLDALNLKAIVHKRNGVVRNYSDAIKFSEFRILG